jgi:hypothetical protein
MIRMVLVYNCYYTDFHYLLYGTRVNIKIGLLIVSDYMNARGLILFDISKAMLSVFFLVEFSIINLNFND